MEQISFYGLKRHLHVIYGRQKLRNVSSVRKQNIRLESKEVLLQKLQVRHVAIAKFHKARLNSMHPGNLRENISVVIASYKNTSSFLR